MCKSATDFPTGHKAYKRQTPPSAGVHGATQLYDSRHGFPLSTHAFFFFFHHNNTSEKTTWWGTRQRLFGFSTKKKKQTQKQQHQNTHHLGKLGPSIGCPGGGVSVEFRKDRWEIKNRLLAWFYCWWSSYGSGDWETITISDEQMYRLTDANPAYMLKSPGRRTTASGQWMTDTLHHL